MSKKYESKTAQDFHRLVEVAHRISNGTYSAQVLAVEVDCDELTIIRLLKALSAMGLPVIVNRRFDDSDKASSTYSMNLQSWHEFVEGLK